MQKETPTYQHKRIFIRLIAVFTAVSFVYSANRCNAQTRYVKADTLREIPETLPAEKKSFIEKAHDGQQPSGFSIRGTKGLAWTPEQYLEEIPVLAKYKMNFLMNCYLSMFTQPPIPGKQLNSTDAKNEWWLPLPDAKKRAYEKVFEQCRKNGINFCFSIHPQLLSSRPADLSSKKDFEDIWQHYAWAQSKGVRWFSVTLDDVDFYQGKDFKINGTEHAAFVNKLLARLRKKDKDVKMIFCPTFYAGVGDDPKQKVYLEGSKKLDKDVYVFWTGPQVVSVTCTLNEAKQFKAMAGHRIIFWDNYPVNDYSTSTVHLAPITGRDKDLNTVVDGYMSNPLFTQNEINRIPLFTMADYAYDPVNYDPKKSIGQAIIHQADNDTQREILLEVVKIYSSTIKYPVYNPIVDQFNRITATPFTKYIADAYIDNLKAVQEKLNKAFPDDYKALKTTITETLQLVEAAYQNKYGKLYKQPQLMN